MSSRDKTARLRVILHADDLGISYEVNDAIFDLMQHNMITSASILANGPAFEDAARRSRLFPNCSFGIHLNLTQFGPLSSRQGLQSFLNQNGQFTKRRSVFATGVAARSAVMREWTCQVTRLRKAGVTISHVDSHHHVHTRIGLMPCLKQVCQEQSLRKIRIRQTIFPARPLSRFRIDNFLYNRALRRSFICADNFGPFGAFTQAEAMLKPGSSVELMIHPGHPSYVGELHALQRSVNDAFYTRHECISYKDLH